MCYNDVCVVDQEPQRREAAMDKLQYLKGVFEEEGAYGVGEQLHAMDAEALRRLTLAAKLPLRAGSKNLSVSQTALVSHVIDQLTHEKIAKGFLG